MDVRSVGLASLCGALALFMPSVCFAQVAHTGYSGLVSTPNAEVLPEGRMAISFNWIEGPQTYLFAPQTNRIYAVTLGLLDRLEVTFRQTQVIGWNDPDAPGVKHAFDRMFSAKYAIPIPNSYPQIAIGVQDIISGNLISGIKDLKPGTTQYGQSTLYGVLGDNYPNMAWHVGFGTSQAFINGYFGGIQYKPFDQASLLGEWDSRGFNWGFRFSPFHATWVQLSLINHSTLSLSSSLLISL